MSTKVISLFIIFLDFGIHKLVKGGLYLIMRTENTLATSKIVSLFLLLSFPFFGNCQNRINADISFGLLHSFSNDVLKKYETVPPYVKIEYFTRKKFEHPYFNILGNVSYRLGKKINAGLQSGIYVHYRERYSSSEKKTTLTAPLQLTCSYPVFNLKANTFGINAAAGILFISLDEYLFKYKNSSLFNLCFYLKAKNGGLLKFGFEKQADFITADFKALSSYSPEETFKYRQKRLAAVVSYGVVIK